LIQATGIVWIRNKYNPAKYLMLTVDTNKLNIEPGSSILDLGCGEGRHIQNLYYQERIHACGLDLDFDSARKSVDGFRYLNLDQDGNKGSWLILSGDCLYLPFKDNSFQVIICSEVLEHLSDYHSALLEMKRILRRGGELVLTVPNFWPERICWALSREYQLDPGGHLRIFNQKALKLEVKRLGFKPVFKHKSHALHSPYWWLKCLNWSRRDSWLPVRLYHKLLVWDILKSPRITRLLEKILNPLMGKSVVLYFKKV